MKVLKETGTVDQCIIKAELPYEVVKAEHGDVLDKMIFMPVVNLGKPGAEEVIDGYIKNMKPKAYELVFKTDDANTRRLIRKYVIVEQEFSSIHFGLSFAVDMMMIAP